MGNKNSTIVSNEASDLVVRSTREEKPVHYTLKIQSFSLLKKALSKSNRYESHIFIAGGYKWKLALYPNGDEKRDGLNHISLYLVTAEDDILSATFDVNVVFTFLVYDSLRDKYLTVQDGKMRRFHAMKTEWGIEKLIPLSTFNNASNGFLVDDCCAFGVDILVNKCAAAANGEVLTLIKQPSNNKFSWEINKFSQLDNTRADSNPFTVENCRWKIRMYLPRRSPKTVAGFLSLYLIFDGFEEPLPQSCKVYAEFEIAVLSQFDKVGPKTRTYNRWFEFGGIDFGWGSSEFMSLRDLRKGFIYNDTLIVEAKINVISTKNYFL